MVSSNQWGNPFSSRQNDLETSALHTDILEQCPEALARLGESTFVTMEAYIMDPDLVEVVYADPQLLQMVSGKPFSCASARDFVRKNLLLTLDPSRRLAGSDPVKVFVDRQADPMNISLVGNSGSGRAVYVGKHFNIKGIGKTVLATSSDPERSNGFLDLVGSLWEMLCSNVLRTNLQTGTSPALAVVDLKNDVKVPWYKDTIPSGMLVRLDLHGELDRPAHLFYREQPVTGDQMKYMARAFGTQDAEKFIERILHGGWSAGNISVHGSLIDYDSVFAIRGRAPQWSFRPNWPSGFFGLESQGQKILLKAMAEHPINGDGVSSETLHLCFDQARKSQMEARFLDLAGLNSAAIEDKASLAMATAVPPLVEAFEMLTMKMYPNFRATAVWDEENDSLSLYDLSRFFRLYPLLRKTGTQVETEALRLIRNPFGRMAVSEETREGGMPEKVRNLLFEQYAVTSPQQLHECDQQAMAFVVDYERFLTMVERDNPEGASTLPARAYVVNEERTYLNSRPGHDTLIALMQRLRAGKITAQRFEDFLHLLIEACNRIPHPDSHGRFQADFRIFLEGYTSTLIDPSGWWLPRLTLFPEFSGQQAQEGEWLCEDPAGNLSPCVLEWKADRLQVIGDRRPLTTLVSGNVATRFWRGTEEFILRNITRLDRNHAPEKSPG